MKAKRYLDWDSMTRRGNHWMESAAFPKTPMGGPVPCCEGP